MARSPVDVASQQVAREVASLAPEASKPERGGEDLAGVVVADGWLEHAPHGVQALPRAAEVPSGVGPYAGGHPRLDAQHVPLAYLQEVVAAYEGHHGGVSPAIVLVERAGASRRGEGVPRRALAEGAEARGRELVAAPVRSSST